ncbi:MAG: substrate-binding domain-containing protein [Clostridia bacterium]|nr:substrate-binding domain-containing protein [Clostridia bacterium]
MNANKEVTEFSIEKLLLQLLCIFILLALFAFVNLAIYFTVTRRLGNNVDGSDQAKMIDLRLYLPFEEESKLPNVDTSFKLEGELPVLDGAAALVPVYAAVIDNVYPEGSVLYEDGAFSDDNYYGENFAEKSVMRYRNTVRGFYAMVDDDADVFFGAYPSEEQLKYASDKGIELVTVPIGQEAFVFFVNSKNPVDNLSVENIRDIYSCKITDWQEVGGAERMINPMLRFPGSGSQNAMDRFMGDTEYGQKSPFAIFGGAIGFSYRYYMEGMVKNPDVKMLAINGVYPDADNIYEGEYPLTTSFYAIYRADNPNQNVQKLIQWILSDEGQNLIELCGYVRIK